MASALSGGFLSTVPPGKSGCKAFNTKKRHLYTCLITNFRYFVNSVDFTFCVCNIWSMKVKINKGSNLYSLVAQTVKCLPTMQETGVQSLGWEDLLEKEMATHSSILAWKIPWMEEPGRL